MEFFIRKNATSPEIMMRLVQDGRFDKATINDLLESTDIKFNMVETKTNKPIVINDRAYLAIKRERQNQEIEEYVITYQFKDGGTAVNGRFEGTFTIVFLDTDLEETSKLIVPIKEKLFINVI